MDNIACVYITEYNCSKMERLMEDEKSKVETNSTDNKIIIGGVRDSRLFFWKNWNKKRQYVVAGLIVVLIGASAGGYLIYLKHTGIPKDDSSMEGVLVMSDLENPDVELTADTSDASVENLKNELKAKIDEQIAAKENPIETVKQLAGVLSNTTNEKRQDQLTNFLEDFLANHEDALWLILNGVNVPDQAQVNYWKAELYAYLVFNLQFLMENNYATADGQPLDTTLEQLKYIDLYLALANDPASHPPISEEYKDILIGYVYREASDFSELKNRLLGGGVAQ